MNPIESKLQRDADAGKLKLLADVLTILALLYLFLLSISLMGASFKLFGTGFSKALINTTSNAFTGLFIGILATSIVQSSSTVTSMVVAMVAAGTLEIGCAIPIVMGANIGTSVTNTIVATGYFRRRVEFGKAVAASTVHDFFNLIVTVILFPIEIATGFLGKAAGLLARQFGGTEGVTFANPITTIVGPLKNFIEKLFKEILSMGEIGAGVVMLIVAAVLLFFSLYFITRVMRRLTVTRISNVLHNVLKKSGLIGIFAGMIVTAIIQSSSITTSLLVPLAASGIITTAEVFPITLGANIGTTITAILAALTGNPAALTVAFAHLLFNLLGVLIIYPVKAVRQLPIMFATLLGRKAEKSPKPIFIYIGICFFIVPIIVIIITGLF